MVKNAVFKGVLLAICTLLVLAISGCICCNIGGEPVEATPTPVPTPEPTQLPTVTAMPTYVTQPGEYVTVAPIPVTVTPTPTAVSGVVSAELAGYGTDKDTYNKGDTATCYVDVKNTGTAVINRVDFRVDVYRALFGTMIHAIDNQSYSVDQQDIQPGTTKRVEIAVVIPTEYKGVSTAGSYRFDIVVYIDGKNIGSFSKNVQVV